MTAAPMYPRMYRMAIFELNWFEARCEAAPPAALLLLLLLLFSNSVLLQRPLQEAPRHERFLVGKLVENLDSY